MYFQLKIDELFEMDLEDRQIAQFIDVNMFEIEVHCDRQCKEQRYNAISQYLAQKWLDVELVGHAEERCENGGLKDELSMEDLETYGLEINKLKIWLDQKHAKFSEGSAKVDYLFSEYLKRPKQLVELAINANNDQWFHFISNYNKPELQKFNQVTADLALIMYRV